MSKINRRSLLQLGALAAAGSVLPPLSKNAMASAQQAPLGKDGLIEATIAELQNRMQSGTLTARRLVQFYLDRIGRLDQDENGPHLLSIIEVNRQALRDATRLDRERAEGKVRGPLHGIPIVLKDNIDTVDTMTTAGSLALVGPHPPQDATVAEKLREAGMVILAKTNLSEWANFRGNRSVSGWSGRGRQCLNPYVLDRSPCTSSSGSAAAVAANLAAASLGTETNGSIVCPSSVCGVVGLKPTVGLTSRAGVIPISFSQDTIGPICRTVADAAAVLGAMTGVDKRDAATAESEGHFFADYTQFLDPNGLQGKRIGIARQFFNAGNAGEHIDRFVVPMINAMRDLGAEIVDPANFANLAAINNAPSLIVLEYEFKDGVNEYLASRPDLAVHTLQDLIDFNIQHADLEMPYFLQQLFEESQARGSLNDPVYVDAIATTRRVSREEGIDEVMDRLELDALFAPTRNPAWTIDLINGDRSFGASSTPAALAGYPLITIPVGNAFGQLSVGATFMGRRWSEPTLIQVAFALEQFTKARKVPEFLPTLRPNFDLP